MSRFWQSNVGESVLLLVISTDPGLVGTISEMVDKLFLFKEAVSQLRKYGFHPILKSFCSITVIVLSSIKNSWESIEDQIVIIG